MDYLSGAENVAEKEHLVSNSGIDSARAKYLSHQDQQRQGNVDPIWEALPTEARDEYLNIKSEVREWLVHGLSNTWRWQNSPQVIDPEFQENDLDHVLELVRWAAELAKDYPDLYAEVMEEEGEAVNNLLAMLIVHDIGEIKLGDVVVPNQKSEEGQKRKKLEPRWARYAIYKSLPPEIAAELIILYDRFENVSAQDKLGLLARTMDKGQASANVARHMVGFNTPESGIPRRAFIGSQRDTLQHAVPLMKLLKKEESRCQLYQFLKKNVIGHFDALEIEDVEEMRQEVRARFPLVFAYEGIL